MHINCWHLGQAHTKRGMECAGHLEGCGARYCIFALISSGILARRRVRVLSITHVLHHTHIVKFRILYQGARKPLGDPLYAIIMIACIACRPKALQDRSSRGSTGFQ